MVCTEERTTVTGVWKRKAEVEGFSTVQSSKFYGMARVSDQHGVAKNVVLWRGESLTILTDKMVFGRRTLVDPVLPGF